MAKARKTSSRLLLIVFRFMTFGFLIAGGVMTFYSWDFNQYADTTTGVVVDIERSYPDGNNGTYRPVVEFTDYLGKRYRATSYLTSSSYNYARGDKLSILYDMRDPNTMRLNNWFELWGFGAIFLVVGGVPFVILSLIARRRKSTRTPRAKTRKTRREYVSHESPETAEDHARETSYKPTVRRNR